MKKSFDIRQIGFALLLAALCNSAGAVSTAAQIRQVIVPPKVEEEDFTWWYISLLVLVLGLSGAIIWWLKNKKAEKALNEEVGKKSASSWDTNSLDADEEMEWLRKNQNLVDKKRKKSGARKKPPANSLETGQSLADNEKNGTLENAGDGQVLPVFGFVEVKPAAPFTPLPLSNDEALLSAIEQTQDEYEEDEEVRELAVRILTAFKTRNSIEALSQVALYDLSSNLRSKAVLTLTEFDHESVFETILLACADPTREVRAAAARGLTRLSLDRADAWARIAETGEEGRICQCARAAIESGFVERSFDRLIHPDYQYSYEAFVLLVLLIKAGETEQIFDTLKNHKNPNVRKAILHIMKVAKNQNVLNELYNLVGDKKLSEELKAEIDLTIKESDLVTV